MPLRAYFSPAAFDLLDSVIYLFERVLECVM